MSSTGETMNRVSVEQSEQEEEPGSDPLLQQLHNQAAFLTKQNEEKKAEMLLDEAKAEKAMAKRKKQNEAHLEIRRLQEEAQALDRQKKQYKMKGMDPKFLRNLKFSKKHNLSTAQQIKRAKQNAANK